MKTLILKSQDETVRAEIKVDVFGTNAQMTQPGYDTRFTNMEIVDNDTAIKAGISLQEIENSFMAVKNLAKSLNLNLTVVDITENDTTEILSGPSITAGPDQAVANSSGDVTLAGVVNDPGSAPVETILWEPVAEGTTGVGTPVISDDSILGPTVSGIDGANGDYVFSLTVTNEDSISTTDTVVITVS